MEECAALDDVVRIPRCVKVSAKEASAGHRASDARQCILS